MKLLVAIIPLFVLLFLSSPVFSDPGDEPLNLRIGIVASPPYLISENGKMSGVCFDLWRLVSDSLNAGYSLTVYQNHDSLLNDLRKGKLDLSICPYTATTERLNHFRLTIPFYISNMGIMAAATNNRPIMTVVQHLFSWKVLRWFVIVLLIVTVFAFFLWLAERKGNSLQFHPSPKGVLDGIWWAFVTMSTVGYGDKIPKTSIGKILAIAWMFFAIGLFFVASGVISSELTLNKLQSRIQNTDDLMKCKVGAVSYSGYAETLARHNIQATLYNTPQQGITALEADSIDAFVYDLAFLNYIVDLDKKAGKMVVIPSGLNLQYFSFMANKNSMELIDRINPAILGIIDSYQWDEILSRYGMNQ